MSFATNFKASPIGRQVEKWKRRVARASVRKQLRRINQATARDLFHEVWARDKGKCRVCGKPVLTFSADPSKQADRHHIVYRSAGGDDSLANTITICRFPCHRDEHEHTIRIRGNGNGLVTISQFNRESGRIVREWESSCPR